MKQILAPSKIITAVLILSWIVAIATVDASPPHPQLRDDIAAGKVVAPYFVTHADEIRARGVDSPDRHKPNERSLSKSASDGTPTLTGEVRALCLLVKFSDQVSSVSADFFDSLMFDSVGSTVRTYYDEISFGQLDMVTVDLPSTIGWTEAPQTYEYYVNNENGTGAYPNNTQKLCEDIVDAVDGVVDFSNYDNDGDDFVDLVVIVHTGSGAEYTGQDTDIWSHKWGINPRLKDGVYISSYTVQPEYWANPDDMTIGVYAHELGHGFFGLPDLYDIDGSSRGIGKWGIMSYGSWLGPNGLGGSPAHPCAWTRIQMGFATATVISANSNDHPVRLVETTGDIYRLWTGGGSGDEYFLVENRQKTGFDSYLPEPGLLIWHIDDAKSNNTQEWYNGESQDAANHYKVALEQSDGLWELELSLDHGDDRDPFPGGLNRRTFDALTTPSSDSYEDGVSYVKLDNISVSADTMTADFTVGFAADIDDDDPVQLPTNAPLGQNYPNPFNPSTTIDFALDATSEVRIDIYNLLGQKVTTLLDETKSKGTHSVVWNGTNDHGQEIASGVYFYRMVSGEFSKTKTMTLVR
ncbi:MAG: M6 family metalloprotease domain-containing protein [candidate division Zixibacteria bacterium]|nr:M6 family metalloprotease domain-containing protein [candidate division Zixibacteria bacterium]